MKRWAVCVTNSAFMSRWEAIGIGLTDDPQLAHLYTRKELADKKCAKYQKYIDQTQFYIAVEIIEVEVLFPKGLI